MSSTLSDTQLLLINNLLYLENNPPMHELQAGKTVGEILGDIELTQLESSNNFGTSTTGKEWRDIINAAKSDPQIANLTVSQSHTDAKYGGTSFLFTSPDNGEAVVAFRGTATAEWKDNFVGGGPTNLPDGVSTECQKRALDWYQSLDLDSYQNVTVTGHSKGGNKAQYIAILDDSVGRCVSFDGQGFSDEFYEKYSEQITQNQHKIVNNSAESDYVNFLLNSVGEQKYYKGYNYGSDAAFAENHCPNTMMTFDENGNPVMNETDQSEDIKNLDRFLNSYLRATDDKKGSLALVGDLVQNLQNGADAQDLIDVFTDETHQEQAAFLIAYLFAYREVYPEIGESIKKVLAGLGVEDAGSIIDILITLQELGLLGGMAQSLGSGLQFAFIPDIAKTIIKDKFGIELTTAQYQGLCNTLKNAGGKLDNITIDTNAGDDRSIDNTFFYIDIDSLKAAVSELNTIAENIRNLSNDISDASKKLTGFPVMLQSSLKFRASKISWYAEYMSKYSESLALITEQYINAEKTNYATFA